MVKTMTLHADTTTDRALHITLPPGLPLGSFDIVLVIVPAVPSPSSVVNLAGRWQAYFPADFDLDSALHEIRHEWEKEWESEVL